ncbi:hypothetical protein SEA_PETTERN_35 [Mycobacterium phage PetterN]|uniref:Uncharacterized protein n=3 Tax=Benedictvirus TaxID=2946819 RepID=A0A2P1N275_9CAUD|nr:hypothetical protein AVV06_gp60 [Mycobacterium phage Chadwick]YP_010060658.1 hypothetical protein KIP48_gp59 [Mycobacterium phage Naca]YP_010060746.1 hypothetical protein KIP49_gp57 [Mycobacterium phage Scorpia]AVR76985.1 hypothetical protein SEA_JABIRU_34 [Mycobacterium phage Jabiru]QGJ97081.1 hypothetical protein SEA_PETTERN_35 [Mycobacterium phage PetterN]ALA06762.1 hypothetical protein SEA_CHADWICK_35 [Mycobacterium phage Chadwick]AVP42072.1 hypothetical protein SEA_NACA_34 [Mycobacter
MTGAYDGRIALALEQIARDLNLISVHITTPIRTLSGVDEVRLRSEPA